MIKTYKCHGQELGQTIKISCVVLNHAYVDGVQNIPIEEKIPFSCTIKWLDTSLQYKYIHIYIYTYICTTYSQCIHLSVCSYTSILNILKIPVVEVTQLILPSKFVVTQLVGFTTHAFPMLGKILRKKEETKKKSAWWFSLPVWTIFV